jgi:hypothetical protein
VMGVREAATRQPLFSGAFDIDFFRPFTHGRAAARRTARGNAAGHRPTAARAAGYRSSRQGTTKDDEMKRWSQYSIAVITSACAGLAWATLPPPTDAAKAQAAETAAKAAWTDKVGAYQTCKAMDRTAEAYRRARKEAGTEAPPATPTPACTDPGPFASQVTPTASKPIEAAGAHSPPGQAVSPPSTNAPAAEMPKK